MKIGFIGAGKVGTTLGKYMSDKGSDVGGYLSRSIESAAESAKFTNSIVYEDMGKLVSDCDVLFLTVPDGSIHLVYEELAQYPINEKIICHCSGAMTAGEAFPDIREKSAYGYSVHPLFAVSDKFNAYPELSDVFFAIEGTQEKLSDMATMLKDIGLKVNIINPAAKTKYHLAAAMSSNLVIGLLWKCVSLMEESGFKSDDALKALAPLVKGNIEHIFENGLTESLTGPVERGDFETVKKHLECLDSEEDKLLYRILSKHVLTVAKQKHSGRDYKKTEDTILDYVGGKK